MYSLLAVVALPRVPTAAGDDASDADAAKSAGSAEPSAAGRPKRASAYGVMLRDVKFLLYLAGMGLSAIVYVQYTVGLPLKIAAVTVVLLCTVVMVSGLMTSGPTMFAHPAKAPDAVKSRYIGASQAVFGVGSALGPVLGVLAFEHLGNGLWVLCAVVGVVSAGCAAVGMYERAEPASVGAAAAVADGAQG